MADEMDRRIREETGSAKSLRSGLRHLLAQACKQGSTFPLEELPSLLEASVKSADLEDLGVEDLDGRQVHHYAGSTDGTAIRDAYARANSFAEVPPPEGALAVEEMQVDFYVDADSGDLLRQSEEARLLLDFAEFGLDTEGVVRLRI